jgi:S1-C subfamily serine protease
MATPAVWRLALTVLVSVALVAGCGSADKSARPGRSPAEASRSVQGATGSGTVSIGGGGPAGSGVVAGTFSEIPLIVATVEPSVVTVLRQDALGSGVVWSADGIIVTNNHVVEGVTKVIVAFADGSRVNGAVLATDPLSDLAVIKAERTGLPAAKFVDVLPPVGSLAIAIGSPLGFANSATAGIVSGTGRSIPGAAQQAPALVDLVQTDAAISPGNSGGALVGEDTRLIGINVAYIPPSASAVSLGFAIPAPTVKDVVGQLLATGKARHAYLGAQTAPLTPQIAQRFGLRQTTGALVVDVTPGSPADAAGIRPGDVIVGIDSDSVNTPEDLLAALRKHEPGQKVVLKVVRGGTTKDITITLGTFTS